MRVNDPGPTADQAQRITELWVWTAISPEHNTEGIIAVEEPFAFPLVGSVRHVVEKLEPFARRVAVETGAVVRLRHFVAAD